MVRNYLRGDSLPQNINPITIGGEPLYSLE